MTITTDTGTHAHVDVALPEGALLTALAAYALLASEPGTPEHTRFQELGRAFLFSRFAGEMHDALFQPDAPRDGVQIEADKRLAAALLAVHDDLGPLSVSLCPHKAAALAVTARTAAIPANRSI
ncbi:hypothetical protein [Streptosporangium roseum]|uniref:hypothetical protein n=1 Tax=Streptosporangium roseum TaxID=2001 RepID=UPI0033251692